MRLRKLTKLGQWVADQTHSAGAGVGGNLDVVLGHKRLKRTASDVRRAEMAVFGIPGTGVVKGALRGDKSDMAAVAVAAAAALPAGRAIKALSAANRAGRAQYAADKAAFMARAGLAAEAPRLATSVPRTKQPPLGAAAQVAARANRLLSKSMHKADIWDDKATISKLTDEQLVKVIADFGRKTGAAKNGARLSANLARREQTARKVMRAIGADYRTGRLDDAHNIIGGSISSNTELRRRVALASGGTGLSDKLMAINVKDRTKVLKALKKYKTHPLRIPRN